MNVFVGELPPPYGGVAVKDKLMFQQIYEPSGVKMINLVECKWKPWKTPIVGGNLIASLLRAEHVIIGVGTSRRCKIIMSLRKILKGNRGLTTTHMIVMGGNLQNVTKEDKSLCNLLKKCGSLWVETNGMKQSLEEQGLKNIKIFPNCRTDSNSLAPQNVEKIIKYVYFSRICEEKGVDEIIDAVKESNGQWTVDFYGEVAAEYKDKFENFLKEYPQIKYHGVYDATNGNVYKELNQYDAILLPSKWSGEGVPGALVESKMAGIAAIVSDWNFNAEIVKNDSEGIVLKEKLSNVLNKINSQKMMELKVGAFESRKRYDIETYREQLLEEI